MAMGPAHEKGKVRSTEGSHSAVHTDASAPFRSAPSCALLPAPAQHALYVRQEHVA
jgi:hypothetical protein